MHLAIVSTGNEGEVVFNAPPLANLSREENDRVSIFLLGEGMELDRIKDTTPGPKKSREASRHVQ